ncbi:MAG: hypothetical protein MJ183_08080 [Treponemataceae bacterium]|nr:hypothetical protein [Treponemataceae bacterium]
MAQSEIILHGLKLILGGIAAFVAILLLSRTRDSAWMLVIAGTIVRYVEVVFDLLVDFGLVSEDSFWRILGTPVPRLIFAVVPILFYIAGMGIMVWRLRIRSNKKNSRK